MLTKKIEEDFKGLLLREGLKLTASRLSVLENILSSDSHRDSEEIFNDILAKNVKISRATIYRTLDVLVKYDYVRKLDIGDGKVKYEKKIGHPRHDHMICIDSGDIIEFHEKDIEKIQAEIAKQHGFEVVRSVHQLFVKPIKK